jgi:hypothetical protein
MLAVRDGAVISRIDDREVLSLGVGHVLAAAD